MSNFEDYSTKYSNVMMRRNDGILEIQLHTNGEEIVWGYEAKHQVAYMLGDIGSDSDNRVIILTGTGETFINRHFLPGDGTMSPVRWGTTNHFEGKKLLSNHLEVQAPMIAVVNGPATIHAELALLCDIVLASEDSYFQDAPHYTRGLIPGDGAHIVWPLLLGLNRARYFLLTGEKISAQRAIDLGIVNEVLPRERLRERAWELAGQLMAQPELTVRLTREAILQDLKVKVLETLGYGLALEGLGAVASWDRTPSKGVVTI
jgi:enoyl-CoA hydratase/carnithine racemase